MKIENGAIAGPALHRWTFQAEKTESDILQERLQNALSETGQVLTDCFFSNHPVLVVQAIQAFSQIYELFRLKLAFTVTPMDSDVYEQAERDADHS